MAEEYLAAELKANAIPFEREVQFCPDRKFRADFLLTGTPLLIEVDGGAWGGRHVSGKGFLADRRKDALAFKLGFIPMHVSVEQVEDGEALEAIKAALFNLVEMGA
jgi:very-short-patch-repair endonuclease